MIVNAYEIEFGLWIISLNFCHPENFPKFQYHVQRNFANKDQGRIFKWS